MTGCARWKKKIIKDKFEDIQYIAEGVRKNKFFLPWFPGSTKIMNISKTPESFPRSLPVTDTLESLSGHSFHLCETIPTNLMAGDLL